jgi:hypothetical protein
MTHEITFVRHDPDVFSMARLKLVALRKFPDKEAVVRALTSAVTDWIIETDEGKEEWEDSSEDFNIGDLDTAMTEKLPPFLMRHGIQYIEIDMMSGLDEQNYDRVLVNREQVEEE